MRKPVLLIAVSLLFAFAVGLFPAGTQAQSVSVSAPQNSAELLAAVNALRAAHGLPAYSSNSILMQIAQVQADYLAATGGAYGHTGPGGTTPRDRASAAGYLVGSFFSENWEAGSGLSPAGAVSAWQGDSAHLNTMLSANLVEAGTGVSKAGGIVYYVLDAGAPDGSPGNSGTTDNGTPVVSGTPLVSDFIVPVTTNTPDANGLVYHEVAYGQTLWSIAIAYGTKIDEIRKLNNLPTNDIYPGEKLLVLKGPTPLPASPTPKGTSTPIGYLIVTPTRTVASPTVTATEMATITDTPAPLPPAKRTGTNVTAIVIIGLALVLAALGTWLGTRKPA